MSGGTGCRFCGDPALLDTIAELEAKLAEREWISVDERLPKRGEQVLWYQPRFERNRYALPERMLVDNGKPQRRTTYWMPLPQPPEGGE